MHAVPLRVSVAIDRGRAELVYAGDAAPGALTLDRRTILSKGRLALFEIMF